MNYFFDTEFHERGHRFPLDLISLGIVAEDGREFYAISSEFDVVSAYANPWLRENVLSKLGYDSIGYTEEQVNHADLFPTRYLKYSIKPEFQSFHMSRKQILLALDEFLKDDARPVFWANFADYDWVALCQLYGTMMQLPAKFPRWCRDLKQEMTRLGIPRALMPKQNEADSHDALTDARWNLAAFKAMRDYEKRRNVPGPSLLK